MPETVTEQEAKYKVDRIRVAAQNGLHLLVRSLVEAGVDLNSSNSRGETALTAAVSGNDIDY